MEEDFGGAAESSVLSEASLGEPPSPLSKRKHKQRHRLDFSEIRTTSHGKTPPNPRPYAARTKIPFFPSTIHLGIAIVSSRDCTPSGFPYFCRFSRVTSSVKALYAFVRSTKCASASSFVWFSASLILSGWNLREIRLKCFLIKASSLEEGIPRISKGSYTVEPAEGAREM